MRIENEVKNPTPLVLMNYLWTIEASVGSRMFQKHHCEINGEPLDVLYDGNLACANFESTIMHMHYLLRERHTKVSETLRDMLESGWYQIPEPRPGAAIHWGKTVNDDGSTGDHEHLGFYINKYRAVSNNSRTGGSIITHHPTFGTHPDGSPKREVLAYFWHPLFDECYRQWSEQGRAVCEAAPV